MTRERRLFGALSQSGLAGTGSGKDPERQRGEGTATLRVGVAFCPEGRRVTRSCRLVSWTRFVNVGRWVQLHSALAVASIQ